ncbi:MAG: hypothetical protein SFY66_05955 [Oculatellaceae cyanobacterium bins.114]|nr:hypothetical protein [Oculatellaceae cyanobacterium bins.114]
MGCPKWGDRYLPGTEPKLTLHWGVFTESGWAMYRVVHPDSTTIAD